MSNDAAKLRELFQQKHYVSVADARHVLGHRAEKMLQAWFKNGRARRIEIEGCGGVVLFELRDALPRRSEEPPTHAYLEITTKRQRVLVYLREHPWTTSPVIRQQLGETEHGSLRPLLKLGRLCRFRRRPDAPYRWALAGEPISDRWKSQGVTEDMLETTVPDRRRSRRDPDPAVLDGLAVLVPTTEKLLSVVLEEAIARLDDELFRLDQDLHAVRAEADHALARAKVLEQRKAKLHARRRHLASTNTGGA